MVEQNTAGLWNGLWAKPASADEDLFRVYKEERLIRWQRIERIVLGRFGGFEDLSVIEIGAGVGTNAALMGKRGAKVSVLDYSPEALDRSARLFQRMGIPVNVIKRDVFDLPETLTRSYDVSMSFGLAEHFLGDKRKAIIGIHLDLLKENGLSFVSIPNRYNPPYRLHKWITERTRAWSVGEEYPFSRAELRRICKELGVEEYGFLGDALWRSKRFLNPLRWLPKRKKPRKEKSLESQPRHAHFSRNVARRLPRKERGTPWDEYIGYALVLWATKPASPSISGQRDSPPGLGSGRN